ncbi:MAG: hypothetical protein ABI647_08940 [Gemmatimonadota bacterium]
MKKFMFVAAVVTLAACGEKKAETPAADTAAAAAPAPMPAPMDSMKMDSTKTDTVKH